MKVKNFMKKAIAFCLGLAMTAGVGYGIAGNRASEVDANAGTVTTFTLNINNINDALSGTGKSWPTSYSTTELQWSMTINGVTMSFAAANFTTGTGTYAGTMQNRTNNAGCSYIRSTGLTTGYAIKSIQGSSSTARNWDFYGDDEAITVKSGNPNTINGGTKVGDTNTTNTEHVFGSSTTYYASNYPYSNFVMTRVGSSAGYYTQFVVKVVELEQEISKKYNVKFDSNGGGGLMSGVGQDSAAYTLPDCEFSAPDGKLFDKWALNSTTGTQYAAGANVTLSEGTSTFYALWKDIEYTDIPAGDYSITFNANKDTTVPDGNYAIKADTDGKYYKPLVVKSTNATLNTSYHEFTYAKSSGKLEVSTASNAKITEVHIGFYMDENGTVKVNGTAASKSTTGVVVPFVGSNNKNYKYIINSSGFTYEAGSSYAGNIYSMVIHLNVEEKAGPTDVINEIEALPAAAYTQEFADKLNSALNHYNQLSASDKLLVTNYSKLSNALLSFNNLKDAAVENVENLITAIGTVTKDSGDKIVAAENAYAALLDGDLGKDLVSNYDVLVAARATYNQIIADIEAVEAVEQLISALPEPEEIIDYSHHAEIQAAKDAYDALTEAQKGYVSTALKEKLDGCVEMDASFEPVFETYKAAMFLKSNNEKDVNGYDDWYSIYDGFKVNLTKANNNNNGWNGGNIKMGQKTKGTGTITTDTSIDKPVLRVNMKVFILSNTSYISSIVLLTSTTNDFELFDEYSFDLSKLQVGDNFIEISEPAENLYYKIVVDYNAGSSSNGLIGFSEIDYQVDGKIVPPVVMPESISLSQNSLELTVGEEKTLSATFDPEDTTNKNVIWSSTDNKVATVEDGTIVGISKGTTTITVTSVADNSVYDECEVIVKNPRVDGLEGDWVLLENSSSITKNSKIVIAENNKEVAMGSLTMGSNKAGCALLCNFDDEINIAKDAMVLTVIPEENGFYFKTSEGKYLSYSNTDGDLSLKNNTTTLFTISVGENGTEICPEGGRSIRFNGDRFKGYASSTGTLPSIYIEYAEQKTVTWNVEGDETEETYSVGEMPSYKGETPTKPSAGGYNYEFSGWDPEVSEVTDDITYTAQFDSSAIEYSITYENEFGGACGNPTAYTVETDTFTLKNPEARPGYMFLGWYNGNTLVGQIKKGSTGDITLTAKWESFEESEVTTEANFKATSKDGHVEKIDSTSLRMCINVRKGVLESLNGYDFRIKVTLLGDNKQEAYLSNYIVRENGLYKTFDATMIIPENMRGKDILVQLEATKGDNTFLTEGETVSYNEAAQSLDRSKLSALQLEALKMILGE